MLRIALHAEGDRPRGDVGYIGPEDLARVPHRVEDPDPVPGRRAGLDPAAHLDPERVAVWGTSFAGGHALVTAATVPGVAAAVCQCPMMDGLAAVRGIVGYAGAGQLLRMTAHGLWDALLAPFGRTHCIPIVGPPGSLAVMSSPDAEPGYIALCPPGFRCEVAARVALTVGLYRPVRYASRARCPVLVQICEHDSVAPPAAAEKVVAALGSRGEAQRYPIGHFEPYLGAPFERSVSDQLTFLRRHLRT